MTWFVEHNEKLDFLADFENHMSGVEEEIPEDKKGILIAGMELLEDDDSEEVEQQGV